MNENGLTDRCREFGCFFRPNKSRSFIICPQLERTSQLHGSSCGFYSIGCASPDTTGRAARPVRAHDVTTAPPARRYPLVSALCLNSASLSLSLCLSRLSSPLASNWRALATARALDGLKEVNWTSQLALGRARRAPCLKERKLELHRPDVPALESTPVQVSCKHMQACALTCNHMQSHAIRWHAIRC